MLWVPEVHSPTFRTIKICLKILKQLVAEEIQRLYQEIQIYLQLTTILSLCEALFAADIIFVPLSSDQRSQLYSENVDDI